LEKAPAEALRLLFLTTHYHQPFNFTFEGLDQAKQNLDKFYNALLKVKDVEVSDLLVDARVEEALEDDLNTPLALSYIHDLVNTLNKADVEKEKSELKAKLLGSAKLLGILWQDPEEWFKGDVSDVAEIEKMIEERILAKKNKDYALADEIRNKLKDKGTVLEDTPQGTIWKRL
jgi:cysteinyl-tRNA synthetase